MHLITNRRQISWLLALAALLLSGCAAREMIIDPYTSIRKPGFTSLPKMGVLSLLPTDAKVEKMGTTIFGNERESYPVADALNDAALASAEKVLRRAAGRNVVVLRGQPPALAARYNSPGLVLRDQMEKIQTELAQLAQTNDLDGIIVISEAFSSAIPVRRGVRVFIDAGLKAPNLKSDSKAAFVMPDISIHVVDKAGKVVALDAGLPSRSAPIKRFDGSAWESPLSSNLDPATKSKVLREMERLLDENVQQTLGRLGF